jgi:hypothetical protein
MIPASGGTPADFAVVQAIREMKGRGLRVTFYPFILMDVPPGNSLPNPYSDNAAETGQPVFPWRGRITCSPAAGYAGTGDKTAAAVGSRPSSAAPARPISPSRARPSPGPARRAIGACAAWYCTMPISARRPAASTHS